uniref:Uncharacterized protein n=1 Tax=Rhizophora mucronata TaxID=61149 RepID=A0A2P2J0B3_RHIMU
MNLQSATIFKPNQILCLQNIFVRLTRYDYVIYYAQPVLTSVD